ncbi:MAG: hypothetical protein EHM72_17375, partial [Calditrichaeota bacterium]
MIKYSMIWFVLTVLTGIPAGFSEENGDVILFLKNKTQMEFNVNDIQPWGLYDQGTQPVMFRVLDSLHSQQAEFNSELLKVLPDLIIIKKPEYYQVDFSRVQLPIRPIERFSPFVYHSILLDLNSDNIAGIHLLFSPWFSRIIFLKMGFSFGAYNKKGISPNMIYAFAAGLTQKIAQFEGRLCINYSRGFCYDSDKTFRGYESGDIWH